jgi:hypothetical protein
MPAMPTARIRRYLLPPYPLTPLVLLATMLVLVGALGCGSSSYDCPSCDDPATASSYGRFTFGEAGDDGTARKIQEECGFDIFDGHNGGSGDTLEIASCWSNGVPGLVMAWAFSEFSSYRVCPGYSGNIAPPLAQGECRVVGRYFR